MFELEKFIEIRKKKPKLSLQSSYFLITKELLENNDTYEFLSDYSHKITADRIYIYLPLPSTSTNLTILDDFSRKHEIYQLVARHLTLDKIFFNNTLKQHGLYPAHYTEEYCYQDDNQKSYLIKVHVYLDKNNNFSYMQATKFTMEGKKLLDPLAIKNLSNTNIFDNGKIASELFGKIIQKRHDFLNELVTKSNQLENHLDQLSYEYMLQKQSSVFLLFETTSKDFIEVINKLNLYTDGDLDLRGKIAQIILNEFKQQRINLEKQDQSYQDQDNVNESLDEFEIVKKIPKDSKKQQRSALIKQLKELYKILTDNSNVDTKDINLIILKLKSLDKAKMIILQLDFMEPNPNDIPINSEDKKIITTINEICFGQIYSSRYIGTYEVKNIILNKFKEACCNGEIENVKLLYRYVKQEVDAAVLKSIIDEIFTFRDCSFKSHDRDFIIGNQTLQHQNNHENNMVTTIKFLYENIACYRINFLIIMGYPIPRQYEFLIDNCYYTVSCCHLFSCILHNKPLLFATLINYGARPNGIGLIADLKDNDTSNKPRTYALSLIKSCLFLDYMINPFFLKKLFAYGSIIRHQEFFLGILHHKLDANKNLAAEKSKSELVCLHTIPELSYSAHYKNLGLNLENIKNIESYIEFLEQLFNYDHYTAMDLIIYFIGFSSKYYKEKLILHDNKNKVLQQKIVIVDDETNLHQQLITEDVNHLSFAYISLPTINPEIKVVVDRIINTIKSQVFKLTSSVSSKLDELVKTAYNNFESINTDQYHHVGQIKNMINLKLSFLKAALLFISFKDQIYKKDIDLIQEINNKRIKELTKLLNLTANEEDKNKIIKMQEIINNCTQAILKFLIPIEIKTTFMLEQHQYKCPINNIQTCEPPPGSIIQNGITIVPRI